MCAVKDRSTMRVSLTLRGHLELRFLFLSQLLLLVKKVRLFVVMRGDFQQPLALNLDELPHVLFGREDEFVVDHPTRQCFEQT